MIGFYLNHFNEPYTLFNALKSVRAAYPDAPIFVQDDKSGADEQAMADKIVAHFGATRLADKASKMGWEGFNLVACELQNWVDIFTANPALTHLFKMDCDTVILGPRAEAIVAANPAADLIGKFCPVGFGNPAQPRTIIEKYMQTHGVSPSVWQNGGVWGGGYFVRRNGPLAQKMIAAWAKLEGFAGQFKALEDHCISALCLLMGGVRAESADLIFGPPPVANIPDTAFSIHPIKNDLARWQTPAVKAVLNGSHAEYERLKSAS